MSDEEEKIRARKLDGSGNPWVLGGTSNLAGRVPAERVRYRKAKAVDTSLPGSKFPAGTIPQVRGLGHSVCPAHGRVGCFAVAAVPRPSSGDVSICGDKEQHSHFYSL